MLHVNVRQVKDLKHEGNHCVEMQLDGSRSTRTQWMEDEFDRHGNRRNPKNFLGSGKQTMQIRGDPVVCRDAYLHLRVIHQRGIIRDDKCVGEAHVRFHQIESGFTGWVTLEHKTRYGGQVLIEAKVVGATAPATRPKPQSFPDEAIKVSDQELEEQRAILASLEASRTGKREERKVGVPKSLEVDVQPSVSFGLGAGAAGFSPVTDWAGATSSPGSAGPTHGIGENGVDGAIKEPPPLPPPNVDPDNVQWGKSEQSSPWPSSWPSGGGGSGPPAAAGWPSSWPSSDGSGGAGAVALATGATTNVQQAEGWPSWPPASTSAPAAVPVTQQPPPQPQWGASASPWPSMSGEKRQETFHLEQKGFLQEGDDAEDAVVTTPTFKPQGGDASPASSEVSDGQWPADASPAQQTTSAENEGTPSYEALQEGESDSARSAFSPVSPAEAQPLSPAPVPAPAAAMLVPEAGAPIPQKELKPWMGWPEFAAKWGYLQAPKAGASEIQLTGMAAPPSEPSVEPTGRRRALIVTIAYLGTPAEFRGSLADMAKMRELTSRLGFPDESTVCLCDSDIDSSNHPTHTNLLIAMRWLTHNVEPGDVLFFHFSGHSVQREDSGSVAPDGRIGLDDGICPLDFPTAGPISEHQIFELLVRRLPSGVRLTALVDCFVPCTLLALPFVWDAEGDWVQEENPYHTFGDVVCLSAHPGEELSIEELRAVRQSDSGLITTALVQALRSLGARRTGPVTYARLFEELATELQKSGHRRQPRLRATQAFDAGARHFRFFDAVPNGNPQVGVAARLVPRAFRS